MSKIKQILEGWGNLIADSFSNLDAEKKQRSEERLNICNECEIRSGNICNPAKVGKHVEDGRLMRGCGCNIAAKSMVKQSKCPLGKW